MEEEACDIQVVNADTRGESGENKYRPILDLGKRGRRGCLCIFTMLRILDRCLVCRGYKLH